MKKPLLIVVFVFLLIGCNMNPNKEERIQKLETKIEMTTDKVNELENKLQILESINKKLTKRIDKLEQQ